MIETLKIVAGSWPIAAMVIVFLVMIGINMFRHGVEKSNERAQQITAQKELEISRFQRQQTAIPPTKYREE